MKTTKSLTKVLKKLTPEQRPLFLTLLALLSASSASALDWSNAQIQSGTIIGGTETQSDGSKVTNIFQSSGKGIIDWGSITSDPGFNLAVNEALNLFNGTSGTTLMRDTTGQASKILGAINATGSLWVVNKAGVFIGSDAAIDVGKQFLAAAGDISNDNFLNGTYNFTDTTGEVWHVGTIKAGDDVILIGAKVVNQGRIQAADQLAVGGFKVNGSANTLAMNVGGGKITFSVSGVAEGGTVINEGVLENAAYVAKDMTPTADISGLTGKFNATTDLTNGTYSTADSTVHYTQGSTDKTLTPATLGTTDAALGTYTAVRLQAQEKITSLKDKGQVNAAILAMEAAAITQSNTAETTPATLGTGTAGNGTLAATKDATLTATAGELTIGDLTTGGKATLTATDGDLTTGDLNATGAATLTATNLVKVGAAVQGKSVTVTGATVETTAAGTLTATADGVKVTANAGNATLAGAITATGANGEVDITATETVSLQAAITQSGVGTDGTATNAGVEISAKAVESTDAGSITATSVKLTGAERVALTGAVSATGNGSTTQDATMIDISGAQVAVKDITATTDGAAIEPTIVDGVQTGFSNNASGHVAITATGTEADSNAVVDGTVYGQNVTISSLNGDVDGSGKVVASGTSKLTAPNGNVSLAGGTISTVLDVQTGGDIRFVEASGSPSALAIKDINLHTTGGKIEVTKDVISSTGTVTLVTESLEKGTIDVGGDIRANAEGDANSTGNLLVSSAQGLNIGGDIIATAGANHPDAGHITLIANDDLTVGGNIVTNTGRVDIETQKLVAPVSAVGDIAIAGDVSAAQGIYVEAHNNDAAAIIGGSAASAGAWAEADHPANGKSITIKGGNGAGIKGSVTTGTVGATDGEVLISAGSGTAFLGDDATDTIRAGNILLQSEGAEVGTVQSSGTVDINANAGMALLHGNITGTNVAVTAQHGIMSPNAPSATDRVAVTATTGNVTLDAGAEDIDNLSVNAQNGQATIKGGELALGTVEGKFVRLAGSGEVRTNGEVKATDFAHITGQGVRLAEGFQGENAVLIINGNSGQVMLDRDVTAGQADISGNGIKATGSNLTATNGTLTLQGGTGVVLANNLSGSEVTVKADNLLALGSVTATNGNLSLDSDNASVSTGALSGAQVSLEAKTNATINGGITATETAHITTQEGALQVTGATNAATIAMTAGGNLTTQSLTATNGAIALEAQHGNLVAGDISGNGVALHAADTLTTGNSDAHTGNLSATAGDVICMGSLNGAKVTLDSGHAIHVGNATATGNLTATADGILTMGDLQGANITVKSGSTEIGDANAVTPAISATGAVDIDTTPFGYIQVKGDISGNGVALKTGGALTTGSINAHTGDLTATANGAVKMGNLQGADVSVEGTSLEVGTATQTAITASGDVDLTATNGKATIKGAIESGGAVDAAASGAFAAEAIAAADGDVNLRAGNGLLKTGDLSAASGNVTLKADTAAIKTGAITAETLLASAKQNVTMGNIAVTGTNALPEAPEIGYGAHIASTEGDITVGAIASTGANGSVNLIATDGQVNTAALSATGAEADVTLKAGTSATVAGATTAAGDVTLLAADALVAQDVTSTDGDITLNGTSVNAKVVSAVNGDADIAASTGDITLQKLIAQRADLSATSGTVAIDEASAVTGELNATTANGFAYTQADDAGALTLGAVTNTTSGNIALNAGNNALALNGAVQNAAGAVDATGAAVTMALGSSLEAATNASLTATDGDLTLTQVTAGRNITLDASAAGSIQATEAFGGTNAIAANGRLTAAAKNNINLATDVLEAKLAAENGAIQLTEENNLYLFGMDAGQDATVTVKRGVLSLQGEAFGDTVAMTAGGDMKLETLEGDIGASNTSLSAQSVNVTAGRDLRFRNDAGISSAITATNGDVTLTARRNLRTDAAIQAAENATLTAGNNLTTNATIQAQRNLSMTARGGDIVTTTQNTLLVEADQATLAAAGKIGTAANPLLTKVRELSATAGYDVNNHTPIPGAASGIYLVQTDGDWTITGLRDFGTGNILAYNKAGLTIVNGEILNKQGNIILAGTNGVKVEANRAVTAETGAITLQGDDPTSAITLGEGSAVSAAQDIFLDAGSVAMDGSAEVTTSGDHIGLRATTDDVTLGTVAATQAIAVQSAGSILNAAGHTEAPPNLAAEELLLKAGANIGNAAAGETGYVTVSGERLQAHAGTGEVALAAQGDLTVQALAPVNVTRVDGTTAEATGSETMGVATRDGIQAGTQVRLAVEKNLTVADSIVADSADLRVEAGENITLQSGKLIHAATDATVRAGKNLALEADTALVANNGTAFVTAGNDLTMSADNNGSVIHAGDNAVLAANGNAALNIVSSENGSIAVTAGGDIRDAQGDATTYGGNGQAVLAQGENLVAENGSISLLAGGTIGAGTLRGTGGSATAPINALEVKAQQVSAQAGKDVAIQSSGNLTIGTIDAIAATEVTLTGANGTATHEAQSGIVAGNTANLIAQNEILDGTGAAADITADKIVLTAGRAAGLKDALEITVSGAGDSVLWGNGVQGVSGDSVPMNVQTLGGNANPTAGAMPGSNVLWLVNGRYFGGDSRFISPVQRTVGSIFEDLPLTIQTNEVFTPFTFLSLDLGLLPAIGQGYIDYPRPVERKTEEDPKEAHE